jgi:hypothetical protein
MNKTERSNALSALARTARAHLRALPERTTGLAVGVAGPAAREAVRGDPAGRFEGEFGDSFTGDVEFLVGVDRPGNGNGNGNGDGNGELADRGFDVENGRARDAAGGTWTPVGGTDVDAGPDGATDVPGVRAELRRRGLTLDATTVWLGGDLPGTVPESEFVRHEGAAEGPVTLVDPFGARGDLAAGRVGHVEGGFDDPVLLVRTARYAAGLPEGRPFEVPPDTRSRMGDLAPGVNLADRDRVGKEVTRAMERATVPRRFFEVLCDVGALAVIAPTLDRARVVPAGPEQYHGEGDTFTHAMETLDRMHDLCVSRGITGVDRVRRCLMAVAHDLGKVVVADREGGLFSDNPPRRFPGHSDAGVAVADRLSTRLGLPGHVGEAMVDGADLHMHVPDLPTWAPDRLIEFVTDHDPPGEVATTAPGYATVDELLDLIAADHAGRWQRRETFEDDRAFVEDPTLPEGAVRPRFHRGPFETRVRRAREAVSAITGYDALRSGLCEDHATADLSEEALHGTLLACPECRSPGPWVGEYLTDARHDHVRNGR